jgi:hypothetical protein
VNALSIIWELPFTVVMEKYTSKNMKRKSVVSVKQIGETTKEEQSLLLSWSSILRKQ